MEPRIQYAQTEDGVNIAYWTLVEFMPALGSPSIGAHTGAGNAGAAFVPRPVIMRTDPTL